MNNLEELLKEYGFPFVAGLTRKDKVTFYAKDLEGQFIGEGKDRKIRLFSGSSNIWRVYREPVGLKVRTDAKDWKNQVNQFLVTHNGKTFEIQLTEVEK